MMLTLCATMSCSSRAIRACSSATATCVTSSRSRSSRRDRSSRPRTAPPASHTPTPAVSSASQAGAGGVKKSRGMPTTASRAACASGIANETDRWRLCRLIE